MNKTTIRELMGVVVFVMLFLIASYLATVYTETLQAQEFLMGFWGKVEYVLLTVVAVVLAPVSTVPLIPVATMLWGSVWAAILSIIGWTLGAQIAFELAKRLGRPVVGKVISITKAERYAKAVLGKQVFMTLLILRMCVPVDVLSYAVGLLVPIKRWQYFLATLFGVSPFAFVFAYASELPMLYQVVTLIGAGLVTLVAIWRITKVTRT